MLSKLHKMAIHSAGFKALVDYISRCAGAVCYYVTVVTPRKTSECLEF